MFETNPAGEASVNQGAPAQNIQSSKEKQKAFLEEVSSLPQAAKTNKTLFYTLIIGALIVAEIAISAIIILNKKAQLEAKDNIITTAQKELAGPLKQIDEQVTAITSGLTLYSKEPAFSRTLGPLWSELQAKTVDNTRFKVFSINRENVLNIEGEAREFTDISKLVTSLKKSKLITGVSIASTSKSKDAKLFTLKATYSEAAPLGIK